MAVAGTYVYDNVDRDGSVTDFRSGWITLDHNAVAVVESGPAAGPNSPNCYSGYQVSLLRAPVSLSVQNF